MGNVLTVFLQLEGKYKNVTGSVIATVLVDLLGDLIAVTLFENGMLGVLALPHPQATMPLFSFC